MVTKPKPIKIVMAIFWFRPIRSFQTMTSGVVVQIRSVMMDHTTATC